MTDKTGKGGHGDGAQIGFGIGRVEGRGRVGRENLLPKCMEKLWKVLSTQYILNEAMCLNYSI